MHMRAWQVVTPWLAAAFIGALAAWLRYDWIQPADNAQRCLAGLVSAPCLLRSAAVAGFLSYGFGYAAWLAAAIALLWRHPLGAWLAVAAGLVALILYCAVPGALALLVGVLRLARLQVDGRNPRAQP